MKDKVHLLWRCSDSYPGYGKWLIFRNLEDLNRTKELVYDEIKSGRLEVVGMKCSTLYYNPLRTGAGPITIGRISVFTSEDDYIQIGMKLVGLVQHDIKFKPMKNINKFAHLPGNDERITSMTIFWNDGDPHASEDPRPGINFCTAPHRDDRHHYDEDKDIWKINVVKGQTQECCHGKWILISNYDDESDINVTNIWHKLKAKIESRELHVIKMECPAPKYKGAPPEIHISTSQQNMTAVGEAIISMVKHDIRYIRGEGLFRDDQNTLFWNDGRSSYEDARLARPGITENWRNQ